MARLAHAISSARTRNPSPAPSQRSGPGSTPRREPGAFSRRSEPRNARRGGANRRNMFFNRPMVRVVSDPRQQSVQVERGAPAEAAGVRSEERGRRAPPLVTQQAQEVPL